MSALKKTMGLQGRLMRGALKAGLLALVAPALAHAACVCGTGRMTNWYPGVAPIPIDGSMSDWAAIMDNPNNNICDGYPGAAITDLDAPIQSTGRDLEQFTYTFDSAYVYAYTKRYASDTNTDNFIYYADTNNDGRMATGEPVVVVSWQGSNRTVGVYLGTYRSYFAGGDPMTCTPGYTPGQTCTTSYADGYHLPGTIVNLPPSGHPDYTGQWGSPDGTEMEWKVSWSDLGLGATPGVPFTFHVASTNSQPGAGSFPAQVDDNMGGCGGKGGTTQYGGVSLTPNQTVPVSSATVYTTTHTLTNTGNGSDNYTLSPTWTGGPNPVPTVTYLYNGRAFTDTSTLSSGFSIAAGQSITITAQYSFATTPAKNYAITSTARSKFDTAVTSQVVDTLAAQQAMTIFNRTVGGYGTFSYSGGTNGLPAALTLTTSAGNDPAASQGYILGNGKTATLVQGIPSGWLFGSGSCSYASSGTPLPAGSYSFSPAGASVTLNLASTAFSTSGDNLNCTFINNKLPTIAVRKLMGGPRVSDADQFTVQLLSGTTLLASSATSGAGEVVSSGSGSISYTAAGTGIAYTLNEAKSAGPTPSGVYAATVACTNNDAPVVTPGTLGESFTPGIGDNFVCWITNTPPLITIMKRSYAGTGAFSFSGTNGVSSSFSLDTSTGNPVSQSFVLSAVNTPTTISETSLPSGWALTDVACVDGSNKPVATTLNNGTLTIPASAVVAGTSLVCTFSNVFKPSLVMTKSADSAQVSPGQVVTYTVQVANTAGMATGVILTDKLSPYAAFGVDGFGAGAPFQFIDSTGAAASGLALGAPLYSKDNGATWSYVPIAAGYDSTITNWKLPMLGTMNGWAGPPAPYPSFSIRYKVQTR